MNNSTLIIVSLAILSLSFLLSQSYAEEITVYGRLIKDGRLIHKYAKVKVDRGNTVRDLGVKICQELEHQAPNKVKVRGHHDFIYWYKSDKSVSHEGIKNNDKVKVDCHPE